MKITDDIFKSTFSESVWISITISLKFVPMGPIDYKSALVQVVAWHQTGEKPLPESMLTQFTDAYIRKIAEYAHIWLRLMIEIVTLSANFSQAPGK